MRSFFRWIAGFFSETSAESSSTRLVLIVSCLTVVAVWAGISLYKLELQDVPGGVLIFTTICVGLKGAQNALQVKKDTYEIRAGVEETKAREGVSQ
jgi:hypothetical protein